MRGGPCVGGDHPSGHDVGRSPASCEWYCCANSLKRPDLPGSISELVLTCAVLGCTCCACCASCEGRYRSQASRGLRAHFREGVRTDARYAVTRDAAMAAFRKELAKGS